MSLNVYWACRTSWGCFLLARNCFWDFLLAWGHRFTLSVEPWRLNVGGDITMKRSICEICQNKIVQSCIFQRHYKPFQYFPSHPKPRRYSVLLFRYHQMHQQTCFPIYVPPWVSYTKESSLRVIVSNTFWRHSTVWGVHQSTGNLLKRGDVDTRLPCI